MRDPNKLTVFRLAHQQVLDVYRLTAGLPERERFHLQMQVRRAAVSTSTNIVEGCARASRREYEYFLNIALGSAVEASYLLDVAVELDLLSAVAAEECRKRSQVVVRALHNLHASVRNLDRESREPEGRQPDGQGAGARSPEPGPGPEPGAQSPDQAQSPDKA